MRYAYPAILYRDKSSKDTWTVIFPDLDGCITFGFSLQGAMKMAKDALSTMLVLLEDEHQPIQKPTPIESLKIELDEFANEITTVMVEADTDVYRKDIANDIKYFTTETIVPKTFIKKLCQIIEKQNQDD